MAPDDPIHRGEADAEASAFFGAGEALERLEHLSRVRYVESGSVVADEIGRLSIDFRRAELDDNTKQGGNGLEYR